MLMNRKIHQAGCQSNPRMLLQKYQQTDSKPHMVKKGGGRGRRRRKRKEEEEEGEGRGAE